MTRYHRTTRILLALAIVLSFSAPMLHAGTGKGSETPDSTTAVQLIHSAEEGLIFRLAVPGFVQDADGRVLAEDLNGRMQESGAPALPYYATHVALPPGATVSVSVLELVTDDVVLERDVQAAPTVVGLEDEDLSRVAKQLDQSLRYAPDPAIYESDGPYPAAIYSVSDPMLARDLRLVELRVFPLRYHPATNILHHSRLLEVSVTFSDADMTDLRPAPAHQDAIAGAIASSVLNFAEAENWRSRPEDPNAGETVLPVGSDAYRIEVNQDGIYELSYLDLLLAGMDVSQVNPQTFQMVYRGQPVSFEFIGDANSSFETDESVRFYGWEYDGSRLERQFIPENRNYFWLWAGGTSSLIQDTDNPTGHPTAPSFPDSVTHEEERLFRLVRTDHWDDFPNEPDAWYWTGMRKPFDSMPITFTYDITLQNPVASGQDAVLTAELLNRDEDLWTHDVTVFANEATDHAAGMTWQGRQNVNIVATTPVSSVVDGSNIIGIALRTADNDASAVYYLNRITVDYPRLFKAVGNQLQFSDENGPHTYEISNFGIGNPASAIVWDISDRLSPARIPMEAANIGGGGPYVWTFGSDRSEGAFIATAAINMLTPLSIARYDVPDISPAGGGADWVAIAHEDFIEATEELAAHRHQTRFGGLDVHVANYEDVINQYGYGFPVPAAIRSYLAHGLDDWTPAPSHVLLVGDASYNPRDLPCAEPNFNADCAAWGPAQPNLVLTDIVFKDRYAGMITSDYTFVLLDNDLLPEMTIGRLAVESPVQANNIVAKIIDFELQHITPAEWRQNILLVADEPDPQAGDFCAENLLLGPYIPGEYNEIHKCLPEEATSDDVDALRSEMRELVVNHPDMGVTFMIYRGHGSTTNWSDSAKPIMSASDTTWWYPVNTNVDPKPVIITSLDCLDGNFGYPGERALSETFHALPGAASVAHWSSTGLGLTVEHTALGRGFYEGLFSDNRTAIGDAVSYSKIQYLLANWHESELYSFTLQGDPAMQVFRPDLGITKSALPVVAEPGEEITFHLQVANSGLYASQPTVVDTLPDGLSFVSASPGPPTMTTTIAGSEITFSFASTLKPGNSISIALVASLADDYDGEMVENVAQVSGVGGLDGNGSNNSDTATVFISGAAPAFLPLIFKP